MTEDATLPERSVSGRNILMSGAVLGLCGTLLLWLDGFLGPVLLLPLLVVGPVVGAVALGVPGILYERRILRERQAYRANQAEAKAAREAEARRKAAASAPASAAGQQPMVVVHVAGGQGGSYMAPPYASPSGAAATPTWTPLSGPAEPLGAPAAGKSAAAAPVVVSGPPHWPMEEPMCVLESSREEEIWEVVKAAAVPAERVIAFTTEPPDSVAALLGFPASTFRRISRVEGEENFPPGDLERIGNAIERHLEMGEGHLVVLPGLENLVEAGNVRNVRKLLEVLRDLAQGSKGSVLVSLDPVSLPDASVTLLERGAHKLH